MDHNPTGSSVRGILQARILEWIAVPFSRGSYQPRDWTQVSCIAGGFLTVWVALCISCCWVAKSCPTLGGPMDCSMPGFSVLHLCVRKPPLFAQTHVCWVSDAIQSSHPLLSLSSLSINRSQHQDLLQWVSSSHQVTKILELEVQHQSFQWIVRVDFP